MVSLDFVKNAFSSSEDFYKISSKGATYKPSEQSLRYEKNGFISMIYGLTLDKAVEFIDHLENHLMVRSREKQAYLMKKCILNSYEHNGIRFMLSYIELIDEVKEINPDPMYFIFNPKGHKEAVLNTLNKKLESIELANKEKAELLTATTTSNATSRKNRSL